VCRGCKTVLRSGPLSDVDRRDLESHRTAGAESSMALGLIAATLSFLGPMLSISAGIFLAFRYPDHAIPFLIGGFALAAFDLLAFRPRTSPH
jgi:hypothetical protein